jgi:hypothetical protein
MLTDLESGLRSFSRIRPLVEAELGALSYDDFAVLQAFFYEGLSAETVARQFGLDGPEEAKTECRAALNKLATRLSNQGVDASPSQVRLLLLTMGRRMQADLGKDDGGEESVRAQSANADSEDLSPEMKTRLVLGVQLLMTTLARERALRVFQGSLQAGRRSAGVRGASTEPSEGDAHEVTSSEDLQHAARSLLQGGEGDSVRFEGDERFGSEGLSLALHFDPEATLAGALVFSDLHVPGADGPVDTFQVRFQSDALETPLAFESENGAVRVPATAFGEMFSEIPKDEMDESFRISIEH